MLLLGLLGLWLVDAVLTAIGIAPLQPDGSIPDRPAAAICTVILLTIWFWVRPRVPRRPSTMTIEDYWRDGQVTAAAALVLFLFEGVSVLGFVWTLSTGSRMGATASFLGIVGLAISGPGRFEQRLSM